MPFMDGHYLTESKAKDVRERVKPVASLQMVMRITEYSFGRRVSGRGGGRLLEVLVATLWTTFPQVTAIPGEGVLLVAGAEDARAIIVTTADALWLVDAKASGLKLPGEQE